MLSLPEVPLEEVGDDENITAFADTSIFYRSMSKQALEREAQSLAHQSSHYPHNPLCEVCKRDHLRQRRYAEGTTDRQDDGLKPHKSALQQLSTDLKVIAKTQGDPSRTSASGTSCFHTVRDSWSGVGQWYPHGSHGWELCTET